MWYILLIGIEGSNMKEKIIATVITFVVSGALGYMTSLVKTYKNKLKSKEENEKLQNEALKSLLQAQLTNTYFVYNEIGEIKDYIYRNWKNLFKIYKSLGGNDYVDELAHRMERWKITGTGILDK